MFSTEQPVGGWDTGCMLCMGSQAWKNVMSLGFMPSTKCKSNVTLQCITQKAVAVLWLLQAPPECRVRHLQHYTDLWWSLASRNESCKPSCSLSQSLIHILPYISILSSHINHKYLQLIFRVSIYLLTLFAFVSNKDAYFSILMLISENFNHHSIGAAFFLDYFVSFCC